MTREMCDAAVTKVRFNRAGILHFCFSCENQKINLTWQSLMEHVFIVGTATSAATTTMMLHTSSAMYEEFTKWKLCSIWVCMACIVYIILCVFCDVSQKKNQHWVLMSVCASSQVSTVVHVGASVHSQESEVYVRTLVDDPRLDDPDEVTSILYTPVYYLYA